MGIFIRNAETEGAEFLVWWERLAGLNQGMQGPQTWKRLKEIAEKVGGWDGEGEYRGSGPGSI